MKIIYLAFILFSALFVFGCINNQNRKEAPVPAQTSTPVTPIFNAADLIGKRPSEVEKILGVPTDTWTPTGSSSNLMQSYALGDDTTVEYQNNRISSLVIFFSNEYVDSPTAHRLVGLEETKTKPSGISNTETGSNWIKIFYK